MEKKKRERLVDILFTMFMTFFVGWFVGYIHHYLATKNNPIFYNANTSEVFRIHPVKLCVDCHELVNRR